MKTRVGEPMTATTVLAGAALLLTPVVLGWAALQTAGEPGRSADMASRDGARSAADREASRTLNPPSRAPVVHRPKDPLRIQIQSTETDEEEDACDPVQVIRDSFKPKWQRCQSQLRSVGPTLSG